MNYIIPATTKAQKATAAHIKQCAKALLSSTKSDRRHYVKYAYLKDKHLYMTDGNMLVRFFLEFEAPGTGFFSLATIEQRLWLIAQNIEAPYPETEPLFEAEHLHGAYSSDSTINIRFAHVLHDLSTETTIGCLDYEYFKLLPDEFSVHSTATPRTPEARECPVVFRADNFEAAIMPIIIR